MESKESKPKPKGNPNSIPHFLHRKLESLRSLAMQLLKQSEYRRKITQAEYATLLPLIAGLPAAFQDQIWRDLKTYNFYDALAMWLDPASGLASYYPQEFVEIGERFLSIPAAPAKPSFELVEKGVSGHIGSYDVFISGDNVAIVEDWKGGKLYKRVVKGLGDFVKKAGGNLRLGWAEFPDFEVIYIYNKADENFGYAVNLQIPEFSEWGYAPFEVKGIQPKPAEKPEKTAKEEIGDISERIEARFVVVYDLKEMARVGTEAQARDLMLKFQRERGWYPPALTTFSIDTWNQITSGSIEGWKKVPIELRPHQDDLNKLVLDNLREFALESQYVDDPSVPSGKRLVTVKRGRAYGELKSWWRTQKTAYPLEWFEGTLNTLQARNLIKRYVNRFGVPVVELVEPQGVSVRHGVEISGIPGKPVAKAAREISAEALDQAGFELLVFDYMDAAKKEWAKREALKRRFDQLANKADWKSAIPLRKFSSVQDAVEAAAAISWFHGGVDFSIVDSEINVWSKGYYFYTGGA